MKVEEITKRLKVYMITSIVSIFLTLIGFSFNVFRLEQTEINSNIRTSSFEILQELANLEQIVYASYYDKDEKLGSPRLGWVKVGMIQDLSLISFDKKTMNADNLYKVWSNNWQSMNTNEDAVNKIVGSIEKVRIDIRTQLKNLR